MRIFNTDSGDKLNKTLSKFVDIDRDAVNDFGPGVSVGG